MGDTCLFGLMLRSRRGSGGPVRSWSDSDDSVFRGFAQLILGDLPDHFPAVVYAGVVLLGTNLDELSGQRSSNLDACLTIGDVSHLRHLSQHRSRGIVD